MDNNEKARRVIEAVNECVAELNSEGKIKIADQTQKAFEGVPVGSLALFYDLMQKHRG
jgi:hypothetical protein